jgi:hypothetical protein
VAYTKLTGNSAAVALLKHNQGRYALAQKNYSVYATQYCMDVPHAYMFAHITRVNPSFDPSPTPPEASANPLLANTYGYLRVSPTAAADCGASVAALSNQEMCTYVWSKAFNVDAQFLRQTYPAMFPTASEDFWRCAYGRMALGDLTFDALWSECSIRSSHAGRVWDHLTEMTELRTKAIGTQKVRAV